MEFQVFYSFQGFLVAGVDFLFGAFPFFEEFIEHLCIFDLGLHFFVRSQPGFMAFELLEDGLRPLGVVPEIGVQRLLFFFFDLKLTFIDVKDTSQEHPGGPSTFSVDRLS